MMAPQLPWDPMDPWDPWLVLVGGVGPTTSHGAMGIFLREKLPEEVLRIVLWLASWYIINDTIILYIILYISI